MKKHNVLLLIALGGLAHWFFGNLYEEIVLAPNMLVHSYAQLKCWQDYFTVSNQIYYYVPFTQISVAIIWYLFSQQKDPVIRKLLFKASVYGALSLVITVIIVTQLNLKLFFGDLDQYRGQLYQLSVIWLILNGIRVGLVGAALTGTFRSYLYYAKEKQAGVASQ